MHNNARFFTIKEISTPTDFCKLKSSMRKYFLNTFSFVLEPFIIARRLPEVRVNCIIRKVMDGRKG